MPPGRRLRTVGWRCLGMVLMRSGMALFSPALVAGARGCWSVRWIIVAGSSRPRCRLEVRLATNSECPPSVAVVRRITTTVAPASHVHRLWEGFSVFATWTRIPREPASPTCPTQRSPRAWAGPAPSESASGSGRRGTGQQWTPGPLQSRGSRWAPAAAPTRAASCTPLPR